MPLTSYNDANCYMDLRYRNRNNEKYSQSFVVLVGICLFDELSRDNRETSENLVLPPQR